MITRTVTMRQIRACPHKVLSADHYREDGSCRHRPHVLLGAAVTVRPGSNPAGWHESMGEFEWDASDYERRHVVTDAETTDGTIEAGGWYWHPWDLVLAP